jgi:hypothetical protein
MKRQKETVGSIVEIKLANGNYAYAQLLEKGTAFFNYLSNEPLKDFKVLEVHDILFIIAVYKDIITQGHWLKVGKIPIREDLEVMPMQFIQDAINPDRFDFYNPNTGEITPTTKDKCKGLERASVWDKHHVEDRIKNYYEGVPCLWLAEDYKLRGEVDKLKWLIENYDLQWLREKYKDML